MILAIYLFFYSFDFFLSKKQGILGRFFFSSKYFSQNGENLPQNKIH